MKKLYTSKFRDFQVFIYYNIVVKNTYYIISLFKKKIEDKNQDLGISYLIIPNIKENIVQ